VEQSEHMGLLPASAPKISSTLLDRPALNSAPVGRCRVAFYSHDTMGLGHLRRNLLSAHALACSALRAISLLVAGIREATAFPLPPRADCLTLPSLRKDTRGQYQSRSLDVSLKDVIAVRSGVICAAIDAFEPDVMIVDNVPRGAMQELDATLRRLRARGRTKCVLGLRDVLDEPSTVRREWAKASNEEAIKDYYDEIWAYGDPDVYDVVRECQFSPEIAAKVRFAGYLDQRVRLALTSDSGIRSSSELGLPTEKFVLCSVGGGQDGASLAEAFAQAELPGDTSGVILTGPFIPADLRTRLSKIAGANPRMRVIEFSQEPVRLVRDAQRVIIMGGYNSVCEALSFEKPALIVPRVKPRMEQMIRAQALRALGLVDVLQPDRLTPQALTQWLGEERPSPQVHGRINFNGLFTMPILLARLLPSPSAWVAGAAT
jgi:predicted glycosyltransferase